MSEEREDTPTVAGEVPAHDGADAAAADDRSGTDSAAPANFTERHPEHFRNPPGHAREFREEDSSPEKE